jgi:hypothetical protein
MMGERFDLCPFALFLVGFIVLQPGFLSRGKIQKTVSSGAPFSLRKRRSQTACPSAKQDGRRGQEFTTMTLVNDLHLNYLRSFVQVFLADLC